jgi:hypothetical protein
MDQSGGLASDSCVVGLSKHLPEYLPYLKEKKPCGIYDTLHSVSKKKMKHYGKTP